MKEMTRTNDLHLAKGTSDGRLLVATALISL